MKDQVGNERTANANVNEYENEETEQVENQPKNERKDNEVEILREQIDDIKERMVIELGVA